MKSLLLEEFEKYKGYIKRVVPGLFYQLLEFKDSQSVGTYPGKESCVLCIPDWGVTAEKTSLK